jgi:hypothetical protein
MTRMVNPLMSLMAGKAVCYSDGPKELERGELAMTEAKVSLVRAVERANIRRRTRAQGGLPELMESNLVASCELAAGERILASLPDDHVTAVVEALFSGGSVRGMSSWERRAWSQFPQLVRECIAARIDDGEGASSADEAQWHAASY